MRDELHWYSYARAPPTASAAKHVDSGIESTLDRIGDAGGDPTSLQDRVGGDVGRTTRFEPEGSNRVRAADGFERIR
ncbi:hypothetical protein AArcSl_3142 [Halalkaliarchaeum desulfuricum]|uniref:Uncharacterized protein n=1 Tax=Halalkaliarchaeum desulfuricum TaxID=2055893 RepID=A0A343TNS7_9EURY|nr:hypothetical protein [Halalkaliarchaeum desulfuricum]AUX10749.1 hypothetical protein AArcSl_3142 [Halalkaliarchaeum desulfuricum]